MPAGGGPGSEQSLLCARGALVLHGPLFASYLLFATGRNLFDEGVLPSYLQVESGFEVARRHHKERAKAIGSNVDEDEDGDQGDATAHEQAQEPSQRDSVDRIDRILCALGRLVFLALDRVLGLS